MHRIFTLLVVLAQSAIISACSCFGPNTFCGVLDPPYEDPQWWIPDVVVMAVPVQHHYYGVDVAIIQVFHGEMNSDTVRVWGDNGALCRLYTGWAEGDTLILALHLTDLMGNEIVNSAYPPDLEREGDYMISGCGVYLLDLENNQVKGSIDAPEEQTMSLAGFGDLIEQCALANGVGQLVQVDPVLIRTIGATPCVEWRMAGGSLLLSVSDAQGRSILRERWNGSLLALDGLAPGTYVVEILDGSTRYVRRVAVM